MKKSTFYSLDRKRLITVALPPVPQELRRRDRGHNHTILPSSWTARQDLNDTSGEPDQRAHLPGAVIGAERSKIARICRPILAICGQDPILTAEALAVIGGASAIGSLLTGWLGGRYPKHILIAQSACCFRDSQAIPELTRMVGIP